MVWLNRNKSYLQVRILRLGYTFSTVGDMVLGPLDEKDATLGDIHFPITVFAKLSLAVGNLQHELNNISFCSDEYFRSQSCQSMHYFLTLLF